jgi:hypothetical protein
VADSLKALDLKRPIREADVLRIIWHVAKVPHPDSCTATNSVLQRSIPGSEWVKERDPETASRAV